MAFVDDVGRILLVLGFAGESKLVLGLAIGNLVDPNICNSVRRFAYLADGRQVLLEPLTSGLEQAREVRLNILYVVHFASERIQYIDDDDFPIRLSLVQKRHNTEDLDLLYLADVTDQLADFADIKRIVVTPRVSLRMSRKRIFPSLSIHAH